MKRTPLLPLTALAVVLSLSAAAVRAETFSVKLATGTLGSLTYSSAATEATLQSTLSNTPLGVFNGSFHGQSQQLDDGQEFIGISKSSRKSREIRLLIADGQARATTVLPAAEETALSDPTKAPAGVMDPVQAIGQLLGATGCPTRIDIYDGRRAIALIPKSSETKDAMLTCKIAYKVTAGPGHLSPLRISNAKMQLLYTTKGNAQSLRQIRLGSGVFNLTLDRMD